MGSSQLSQVLIVLLFLCVLPCLTESALPSHQQPLPCGRAPRPRDAPPPEYKYKVVVIMTQIYI
ncbi:unnamed protein product [Brassica rapa]|uniref:Uncharacterized protein n=1 Tax=Brassica campestris TaxID=3711 RepID=A0A8D9D2K0_BRACM|nr:unnamed protein product [Brassica rapa]